MIPKTNLKICQVSEMKPLTASEANLESCQTSKMSLSKKIVENKNSFTIFAKTSISDLWQGSEYASELASKNQGLANINQIFQNIYHVDLHFT